MKTQNNFNSRGIYSLGQTKEKENKSQITLVNNTGQIKNEENQGYKIENLKNGEKLNLGETPEQRERMRKTEKSIKGESIPTSFQKVFFK